MRVDVMTGEEADREREPVELVLGARHVMVEVVVDRWHGAGYRYFKLLGRDGALYILRHGEASGEWELASFERSPRSAAGLPRRSDAAADPLPAD
jgi:hypothetical protein